MSIRRKNLTGLFSMVFISPIYVIEITFYFLYESINIF